MTDRPIPWYCADCAVAVPHGDRCKICGQTERDHLRKVDRHRDVRLSQEKRKIKLRTKEKKDA